MANILAVDDDGGVLGVINQMLTVDGHEVLAVGDGLRALAVLSRKEIDLMILDLQMPNLDGWKTLSDVRRNGYQGPVLILSGFGARMAAKGLRCGWGSRKAIQSGKRRAVRSKVSLHSQRAGAGLTNLAVEMRQIVTLAFGIRRSSAVSSS